MYYLWGMTAITQETKAFFFFPIARAFLFQGFLHSILMDLLAAAIAIDDRFETFDADLRLFTCEFTIAASLMGGK